MDKASDGSDPILTLHRYFIWQNKMRDLFDETLKATTNLNENSSQIMLRLYMSYWYGGLYVVIEGWKHLKLSESKIDELLTSPNTDLLRRYRNCVFHFQEDYDDKRFEDFYREENDAVSWVRELNNEFGKFFLNYFKN